MAYLPVMRPFSSNIPDCLNGMLDVAVMDGSCALCSFGARMIHRLDRTGDGGSTGAEVDSTAGRSAVGVATDRGAPTGAKLENANHAGGNATINGGD